MKIESYEFANSVIEQINTALKHQAGIDRMGRRVDKLRKKEEDKVFCMVAAAYRDEIETIEVRWSQLARHYFYLVIRFKEYLDTIFTDFVCLEPEITNENRSS